MNFSQKCYELLKKVPLGKVTTYRAIAEKLNTNAYRAVGRAMNKNPSPVKVPCHRVINSDGKLGGYSRGIKKKIRLLKKEGIKIVDGKIDLEKFRWFFKLNELIRQIKNKGAYR